MFSRLVSKYAQNISPYRSLFVRECSSVTSSKTDAVAPHDVKNEVTDESDLKIGDIYRRKQPLNPGKVRFAVIPEEWFQMFYKKTGVTGPYAFGLGLSAFILSKEIIVVSHEILRFGVTVFVIYIGFKKFGPPLSEFLDKCMIDEEKRINSYRDNEIVVRKDQIEHEQRLQHEAEGQSILFEAKRENVGLQLEAAYRQRIALIQSMVKKKLDYQLETTNVKTKIEQRHMVDWIVNNVRKAITPPQEMAALKQCLGDLKTLAAKA